MKFRASLQVPRQPNEDINDGKTAALPGLPGLHFKMSSLRHKKSSAWLASEENLNARPVAQLPTQNEETDETQPQLQQTRRKQAVQDFFRKTSSRFRTAGISKKPSDSGNNFTRHLTVRRKTRVQKQPASRNASKRDSQLRSFDISDEVLNRLVGPVKPEEQGKIQSSTFLVQQRVRASSRQASSSAAISPLKTSSQVELDRKATSQAELDRQPLSQRDVEEMFVGAPYFQVQEDGDGLWRPQVVFRGTDVEASKRYGTDHAHLLHPSFGASTLGLHRTRETVDGEMPAKYGKTSADLDSDIQELPSMLSANGLDPGTIGFEHFLQLAIADSAVIPDEPSFDLKRALLCTDPEQLGLREMNMEVLIHRLTELGELYAAQHDPDLSQPEWSDAKVEEMGEELFGRLLDGELGTTGAGTGDVSLRTQITALQKVLGEKELWYNFSQVEWRIRVGQLLWASEGTEPSDTDGNPPPSERDVLLLQITLASELLVRLQAVKQLSGSMSEDEIDIIDARQSKKIQWDLVLSRTFLKNLTIRAKTLEETSRADKRVSLFSAFSFRTARETPEEVEEQIVEPALLPRNQEQQLAGLLTFGEKLQWPHLGDVQKQLEARLSDFKAERSHDALAVPGAQRPVSGISTYATPLSSPRLPAYTPSANRKSWLGGLMYQHQARPGISRMTTANSIQLLAASPSSEEQGDGFEVGGWLSRSWLAGLVLPGEPASHFLISTLLENSSQAIEALGDEANLYGGFIYQGRGFWSKSCVVGRVLAATRGSQDCMGWLSMPIVADSGRIDDGWVNLDIKDVPNTDTKTLRIKDTRAVASDSDPLHGATIKSLQAGDFSTPLDGPFVMGNDVKYSGLSFDATHSSSKLIKAEEDHVDVMRTHIATMIFTSPANTRLGSLEVPLAYDVNFVASYPCHPQPRKPTSPTIEPAGSSSPTAIGLDRARGAVIGPAEATDSNNPEPTTIKSTSMSTDISGTDRSSRQARADAARASGITLSLVDIEKELPPPPAHPLHFEHHYSIIPVASLLSAGPEKRPRALSSPEERGTGGWDGEVVVLDCRGTHDLELLARAWCAKVGENALVGAKTRTCLACCVREARGLGIGVVIRT
ncbi:hypothetical protein LTR86_003301 [Recurvomyces mirabilis]|nr:hypothetical protein LTR86_003301 [Recurvomyces mirabilis]